MMLNVRDIFSYRVVILCFQMGPILTFTIGWYDSIYMLSTPWCSRAVPQPSTDLALHRFAAEFGWDPAFSMQYGRQLITMVDISTLLKTTIGLQTATIWFLLSWSIPSHTSYPFLYLCRAVVSDSTGYSSIRLTIQPKSECMSSHLGVGWLLAGGGLSINHGWNSF